ncbi:MAG: hypothetical protein DMF84_08595 [Acidobacteria bacterium]|nr:MAG: hypothetical protein DMF84_08595 [Acidobacteriota bacterium]
MSALRRFLFRLLNVVHPGRAEPDLVREVRSHLALLEDEFRRRGMSKEEARLAARRAFGGIEQAKDAHRDARSFVWLDDLRRDSGYAARLLRRNPLFAVTASVSLAIGIGAGTTVFTAANTLLLRTAPGVAEPDRLVDINRTTGELGVEPITYSQYLEIRERATLVQHVYAYALDLTPMSLAATAGGGGAEPVFGQVVTPNYFAALAVVPTAGRLFGDQDMQSVAVLSHRFWTQRFNGDAAIIGRTLRLSDRVFTIVGVARQEFHGNTVLAPDLWVPLDRTRTLNMGLVGARLKPGVSLPQAAAEIETIGRTLSESLLPPGLRTADAAARRRRLGLSVSRSSPIPTGVRLLVGGFLTLLMAIVMLVLVIACMNVAGMLLARATARRREIAVRLAMGVGRARLIRQLLTETILLFALGGASGLLLSRAINVAILHTLPSFPLPWEVSLAQDGRVAAFAISLAFGAAVVFGLAPALQASNVDVVSALKTNEHGPSSSLRIRRAFVVAEIALSVLLVVVGGLLARALARAGSIEQGFDSRGVEVASIDLSIAGYTRTSGPMFARDLLARVRRLPGVESAALAFASPAGGLMGFQIAVPGATPPDGRPFFEALGNVVSPGYLAAMRVPLVAGREFTDADSAAGERVAVIGESTVRQFWPGISSQEAVGRQIVFSPYVIDTATRQPVRGAPLTVVGVARDLQRVNGRSPRPFVCVPLQQQYVSALKILARTVEGKRIASELRSLVTAMDPKLPVLNTVPLDEEGGPVITQLRIAAAAAGSLGVVGFFLAAVGIYGIMAHMVTRRTREIGIRIALGADRTDLVRMVLREGMRFVTIGSAVGLLLAAAVSRMLINLLFGVPPLDPVTYGGTVVLFAVVGLAACYVPLRRALGIDPNEALRYE